MITKEKPRSRVIVAKYLIIIILPVTILLSNLVYLSLNKTFQADVQQKIESTLNIDDRIRQNNKLIEYYQSKELLDHNFYSHQAVNHLQDVKNLLISSQIILGLSIIITLAMITIIAHAKMYENIFTSMFYGSVICLIFMMILGLGLISSFDPLFTGMHRVLFISNTWEFPPDDSLVQIFPEEFFVLFANQLSQNVIYTSSVLVALSLVGKLIIKKKFKA